MPCRGVKRPDVSGVCGFLKNISFKYKSWILQGGQYCEVVNDANMMQQIVIFFFMNILPASITSPRLEPLKSKYFSTTC